MRKAVPPALRAVVGKRELEECLGTRDPVEACRLGHAAGARIEATLAAAREVVARPPQSLTARQVGVLVGEWYREQVPVVEASRDSVGGCEAALDSLLDRVEGDREEREFTPQAADLADAAEVLEARGVYADAGTIYDAACQLFGARVGLAHHAIRIAGRDFRPDDVLAQFPVAADALPGAGTQDEPPRPAMLPAAAPAKPLRRVSPPDLPPLLAADLLASWAAEAAPAPATLRKYGATFRQLARVLGFDDVRRITEVDVVKFKAARLAAGINLGTITDDVLAAGGVCSWAVTNKHLLNNPFKGLALKAVRRRGPAARVPFDDDDARRILLAARNETGCLRWVSWLLAFTGARIGEIAELRRQDVRQYDGVWILDVVPTADRALKNEDSQRMLPLHPDVLAEGFLAYVAGLPNNPAAPLFADLKPAPVGGRAAAASTLLGRWVRQTVGITAADRAPNHSWRHRMQDELRRVQAHPEIKPAHRCPVTARRARRPARTYERPCPLVTRLQAAPYSASTRDQSALSMVKLLPSLREPDSATARMPAAGLRWWTTGAGFSRCGGLRRPLRFGGVGDDDARASTEAAGSDDVMVLLFTVDDLPWFARRLPCGSGRCLLMKLMIGMVAACADGPPGCRPRATTRRVDGRLVGEAAG